MGHGVCLHGNLPAICYLCTSGWPMSGANWGTPDPPSHVFEPGALPSFCVKSINLESGKGYFCNRHMDDKCHIPSCEHCGGSGLLNCEVEPEFPWEEWKKEATWCHGCPRGLEWKELLNG